MSMLIKPLSGLSAADDPAITAANYPGLIYGVNASSVNSAGNSLTSVLGDVVQAFSVANAVTADASGEFFTTGVSAIPTSTGSSGTIPGPAYATDKVLALYVGDLSSNTAIASIGDATNARGFGFSTGAVSYITRDAANYHTLPNLTKSGFAGGLGVMANVVDLSANTAKTHAIDSAGLEVASTVATLTLAGAWGDINQVGATRLVLPGLHVVYGMYLFYLSSLPTDSEIAAMLGWMYANPSRLYPGLAGRA